MSFFDTLIIFQNHITFGEDIPWKSMAFFEEEKTEQRGRLSVFFFVEVFMHCRVLGKTAGNHTRLSSCRKGPFRGCREGCAAQLLYSAVLCILQTHLPAGGRGLSCNKAAIGILINEISTSNYIQIAFIFEGVRPFNLYFISLKYID